MIAIYARQSVDRKDSLSIEAQIALCRRQAQGEIVEFADRGYSGKNTDRPAFRQMMEAVRRGGVERIVVYRLDRVSRSIADFSRIWEILDRLHVAFVSVNEQFDTSTPMGRAMVYIIMVFAQLERETIAQRVADSYRYRAVRGNFMGGGVPYGYRAGAVFREGRRVPVLEPDPEREPVVRRIYGWYLSGLNTHRIAERLNGQGIASPGGGVWAHPAVRRVLRNIRYAAASAELLEYLRERGVAVAGRPEDFDGRYGAGAFHPAGSKATVCPGVHHPMVSARDWVAVQRRMDTAAGGERAPRMTRGSWLTGLLRCTGCGRSFGLRRTVHGGREYRYYCCRGRTAAGSVCPNARWVRADGLEEAVEAALIDRVKEAADRYGAVLPEPADHEGEALRARIAALREEIRRLMQSVGRGGAVVDRYLTARVNELDREVGAVSQKLAFRESARAGQCGQDRAARACEAFRTAATADKSVMARLLIRRIEIPPEGGIRMICNF